MLEISDFKHRFSADRYITGIHFSIETAGLCVCRPCAGLAFCLRTLWVSVKPASRAMKFSKLHLVLACLLAGARRKFQQFWEHQALRFLQVWVAWMIVRPFTWLKSLQARKGSLHVLKMNCARRRIHAMFWGSLLRPAQPMRRRC